MEPIDPSGQHSLSLEERNFMEVKLIMLDIDWADREKPIYEYYLGRDDSTDDEVELDEADTVQIEIPEQHQNSVPTPIIINFCESSEPDPEVIPMASDSLCNDTNNNSKMDSLDSRKYSPELEAETLTPADDAFVRAEESDSILNISQPDSGIGEEGCDNQAIQTPIDICMPTIALFPESLDFTHKSSILVNDSNLNNISIFPQPAPVSHTMTSYSDQSDSVSHSLRVETSIKRRHRSNSSNSRSIHSTPPYYTVRPATHRSLPVSDSRHATYSHSGNRANSTPQTNSVNSPIITIASYSDSAPLASNCTDYTDTYSTPSIDPDSGPYQCPECEYSSDVSNVIEHYCDTHFCLTCPRCDNSVSEPHFFQHCRDCEVYKPELQCPNCELTCADSSLLALAMHIKFSHPIKTCVVCRESFVPHQFVEHARICFFEPKHECICPYCEKELYFNELNEHLLTHPIAECPLCYKDIAFPEAKQHMESCYFDKVSDSQESFLYNCHKCKLYFTLECMPDHIIQMHLSLICVFCYKLMSHDEMRQHIIACCQMHQNVNTE